MTTSPLPLAAVSACAAVTFLASAAFGAAGETGLMLTFPLKVRHNARSLVDQGQQLLRTPGDNGTGTSDSALILSVRSSQKR